MRKQYQFRLPEKTAEYLDKTAAKYLWTPSTTVSVTLETYARLQKIASSFQFSVTDEGEEIVLYKTPTGELEVLEGSALSEWLLKELQKGLMEVFTPPQGEGNFFESNGNEYPDDAVGRAMMAVDGFQPAEKKGKK